MLYLFAYSFGRHSAAKLVHLSFFVASLAAMLSFARRHGAWRAGVAAVILFACSPVVIADATSSYNDCALAFYEFLVFYGLLLWWRDRDSISLPTLGVLAGFCFALKYTGGVAAAGAAADGVLEIRAGLAALGPGLAIRRRHGGGSSVLHRAVAHQKRRVRGRPGGAVLQQHLSQPALHGELGDRLPRLLPKLFLRAAIPSLVRLSAGSDRPRNSSGRFDRSDLSAHSAGVVRLEETRRQSPAGGGRRLVSALVRQCRHPLSHSDVWSSCRWRWGLPCCPCPRAGPRFWAARPCWPTRSVPGPRVLPHWAGGVWSVVGMPWKAALRLQPEREYLLTNVPHYLVAEVIEANVAPPGRVFSLDASSGSVL